MNLKKIVTPQRTQRILRRCLSMFIHPLDETRSDGQQFAGFASFATLRFTFLDLV